MLDLQTGAVVVSTLPGWQGHWLRQWFGEELVVFGFTHEVGTYRVASIRHSLPPVLPDSYESYFATPRTPRFLLDLRGRDLSSPGSSWVAGPRAFRSIGCCAPGVGGAWVNVRAPEAFDVLIHIRSTRPSRLVPTRYPETF